MKQVNLPQWVSKKALMAYFLAMLVIMIWMGRYAMAWYNILFGVVSVFLFFWGGGKLTRSWAMERIRTEKRFVKKIFALSFFLRMTWMLLIYFIFMRDYGNPFGFDNADATLYDMLGTDSAEMIKVGNFHFYDQFSSFADLSDMGYGVYLGFVYVISDNSVLLARILKCIWSSLTVVLIYRLAQRNFDEPTARMAAIFCMLWPNFWYYCGVHLKEVEMVFLGVLFVEQADQMLRTRNFSAWKVVPLLLISAVLFTIRTPLALISVLALLFTIVMSSTRVVSWGKRIIIGILAVSLIGVTMGNRIEEQSKQLLQAVQSKQQAGNMEWRSKRKDGNSFAKYASAAVFAPLILTIPFPTMTQASELQHVQQLLGGGNYIKNALSGFTILVLFMLLFSGKWRDHMLPLSFMLGYLVVLTMSSFPHSERFHQPVMPFEMMFAAYGIAQVIRGVPVYKRIGNVSTYRRWFSYWYIFCFVAALAWNWIKLAGRGLI